MDEQKVAAELVKIAKGLVAKDSHRVRIFVGHPESFGSLKDDLKMIGQNLKGYGLTSVGVGRDFIDVEGSPSDISKFLKRLSAVSMMKKMEKLAAKEKRIDILRRIVDNHQQEKIEGVTVDALTANMLVTIHDALSSKSRAKFDRIPLKKLVDFGWSMVK